MGIQSIISPITIGLIALGAQNIPRASRKLHRGYIACQLYSS